MRPAENSGRMPWWIYLTPKWRIRRVRGDISPTSNAELRYKVTDQEPQDGLAIFGGQDPYTPSTDIDGQSRLPFTKPIDAGAGCHIGSPGCQGSFAL